MNTKLIKILGPDFKILHVDYRRRFCRAIIKKEHTQEDILRPHYWSNVSVNLAPYDTIEVIWEDGSLYGELLVLRTERGWASVAFKYTPMKLEYTEESETPNDEFEVKLRGPRGWSVVRKADGQVIKENLPSKSSAHIELEDHVRKISGKVEAA